MITRYVPRGTLYTHPREHSDKYPVPRPVPPEAPHPVPTELPRRTCPTCRGEGVESWTGPHAGSCSECHGIRTVVLTVEEMREAYAEVRARACAAYETTPEIFDGLVRGWLPEGASPAMWVNAAVLIWQPSEPKRF